MAASATNYYQEPLTPAACNYQQYYNNTYPAHYQSTVYNRPQHHTWNLPAYQHQVQHLNNVPERRQYPGYSAPSTNSMYNGIANNSNNAMEEAAPITRTDQLAQLKKNQNVSIKRKAEKYEVESEQTESKPSALRALLTNPSKKIKYSPDYLYSQLENEMLKNLTKTDNAQNKPFDCKKDYVAASGQIILSPNRSEIDDYIDIYSPQSLPISNGNGNSYTPTPPMQPKVNGKDDKPAEIFNNVASLAEVISTPPLSPEENLKNTTNASHEINHEKLTAIEESNPETDFNWSNCDNNSPVTGQHIFLLIIYN